MTAAARLRDLLQQPSMVVAPGAYDAISAMTIEQAGFAAMDILRDLSGRVRFARARMP